MSLTEKEKAELEMIDDPRVEYMASGIGSIFSMWGQQTKRKERVVFLRTKMRMGEMGLGPDKNSDEWNKILKEEEERFYKRFPKKDGKGDRNE